MDKPSFFAMLTNVINQLEQKMLKGKRREILTSISQAPRKASYFTHGGSKIINPDILQMYLGEMVENGYLVESDGEYSITILGRNKLDTEVIATPRTVISREPYVPPKADATRPGADDHKQYRSKGF